MLKEGISSMVSAGGKIVVINPTWPTSHYTTAESVTKSELGVELKKLVASLTEPSALPRRQI